MAFYTHVERIGNNLCIRAVSDTGKRKDIKLQYKPSLFEVGFPGSSEYSDLDGNPLKPITFDNMYDANAYIRNNNGKRLYGIKDFAAQFVADYYSGDIAWDINHMRIILMDIETECHDGIATHDNPYGEILSISAYDTIDGKIHFWHRKNFENKHDDVICHFVPTEKELLKSFLKFWMNNGKYPDIVSHWNGSRYDIPYIVARIRIVFGDSAERILKKMSPFGKYREVEVKKKGTTKTEPGYEFSGICNFDYMDAYRKFNPREQESFSLDYICRLEIDDGKIPFDGSFTELYEEEPQTFFEYSIHDTRLLVRLDKKLRNIELACQIAYLTKAPEIIMSLGTVNLWEIFIYNALYEKNILPELKGFVGKDRDNQYEGAFVKHPHVGKYDWIVSFDAASLYPSVARTFNVSIETFVEPDEELNAIVPRNFGWEDMLEGKLDFSEELRRRGLCISANRQFYRTDKEGILPELFGRCLEERKIVKKEMLKTQQQIENELDKNKKKKLQDEADRLNVVQASLKVLANSLYGAVGNQYFQFYRVENAEAITKGGHGIITITEATANKWLDEYCGTQNTDRVIAIDTDSVGGDSIVDVNGTKEKIEDLFNRFMPNAPDSKTFVDVKKHELTTKCFDGKNVLDGKINYIMRHKTKKKMFKVTDKKTGKSVIMTEDHSLMLMNKGKLVGVKPGDVISGKIVVKK